MGGTLIETTGERKGQVYILEATPRVTTLTFLFADLRDYSAFVERRGDAAAAELIRDYRVMMREEINAADGAEIKTEGDSFYVVFDTAQQAVRCAIAIQRMAA